MENSNGMPLEFMGVTAGSLEVHPDRVTAVLAQSAGFGPGSRRPRLVSAPHDFAFLQPPAEDLVRRGRAQSAQRAACDSTWRRSDRALKHHAARYVAIVDNGRLAGQMVALHASVADGERLIAAITESVPKRRLIELARVLFNRYPHGPHDLLDAAVRRRFRGLPNAYLRLVHDARYKPRRRSPHRQALIAGSDWSAHLAHYPLVDLIRHFGECRLLAMAKDSASDEAACFARKLQSLARLIAGRLNTWEPGERETLQRHLQRDDALRRIGIDLLARPELRSVSSFARGVILSPANVNSSSLPTELRSYLRVHPSTEAMPDQSDAGEMTGRPPVRYYLVSETYTNTSGALLTLTYGGQYALYRTAQDKQRGRAMSSGHYVFRTACERHQLIVSAGEEEVWATEFATESCQQITWPTSSGDRCFEKPA